MTKNEVRHSKKAELVEAIEVALKLADELDQPMTGVFLDQALNAALAVERDSGS